MWAAKHTIKHMFESHHTGRLFPNIQELPGLKPHIDAVRAEEIQCKNNEAVYLYACVQFGIGSFQHCTQILNISYISLLHTANKTAVQPYYDLSID